MAVAGGVNVPLFVVLGLVSQKPARQSRESKITSSQVRSSQEHDERGRWEDTFPFPVIHRHIGDAHSDGWPAVTCLSPQRHQSVTATST